MRNDAEYLKEEINKMTSNISERPEYIEIKNLITKDIDKLEKICKNMEKPIPKDEFEKILKEKFKIKHVDYFIDVLTVNGFIKYVYDRKLNTKVKCSDKLKRSIRRWRYLAELKKKLKLKNMY
jgi:transketolase